MDVESNGAEDEEDYEDYEDFDHQNRAHNQHASNVPAALTNPNLPLMNMIHYLFRELMRVLEVPQKCVPGRALTNLSTLNQ